MDRHDECDNLGCVRNAGYVIPSGWGYQCGVPIIELWPRWRNLVDALARGASDLRIVRVRVSPSAPWFSRVGALNLQPRIPTPSTRPGCSNGCSNPASFRGSRRNLEGWLNVPLGLPSGAHDAINTLSGVPHRLRYGSGVDAHGGAMPISPEASGNSNPDGP